MWQTFKKNYDTPPPFKYGNINGNPEQQTEFLQVYKKYLKIQDKLLDLSGLASRLPGLHTGPVLPEAAYTGQTNRSNTAVPTRHNLDVAVFGE